MPDTPKIEDYASDAPLSAAVDQRGLQKQVAEEEGWDRAAVVSRTVTINRPREELYAFWRDFRNLPRFMENVKEVTLGDNRTSHWVVSAPAGTEVKWDSQIVEDEPGRLISWEALPNAQVRNAGRVEFKDAPTGRGTEVRAVIAYEPPGGDLGKIIAKIFQREPQIQTRRDLRRFKQLMETGEIPTSEAGPAAPRAQ